MAMHRRSIVTAIVAAVLILIGNSLNAGLINHWRFEEGSGTTTADAGSAGAIGTLMNGAAWDTTEFAPIGSTASIRFDGDDDRVQATGYKAPLVQGTLDRTYAAWIKTAPTNDQNDGIFGMGTNTGGLKWTIRTQRQNGPVDGNLRVEVNGGYKTGTTVIDDGEWHHIAVTWTDDGTPDVNDALLYVDGVLETTDAVLDETMNTANGIDVRLGESVNGRNWDGWLDDMRIYDEVLDADAIFALANIPEPSAIVLAAFGLLGLLCGRRRRRK
ncbi:MAG: LamG domain-containing protein [Planctomycetes bacterium]|nr:LamG domain-containing protein [Planctomycetota bacterium]